MTSTPGTEHDRLHPTEGGEEPRSAYPMDGNVVSDRPTVNPHLTGTKAAVRYTPTAPAHQRAAGRRSHPANRRGS
jgi:hypothetical protein